MSRRAMLSCVAVVVALVAAACGGSSSSPSSPSGSGAVTVQGVVLGGSAGVAPGEVTASSHAVANSGTGTITVTVAGTSQTTTVSASGTFELTTDAGTFTLIFQSNGVEVGRIEITAQAGGEVKIVVQIQSTTLTVVEIKVDDKDQESGSDSGQTCVIEGGKVGQRIELEGNVSSLIAGGFMMKVDGERSSALVTVTAAPNTFTCNGDKKSGATCTATTNAKVHVRGTLTSCTPPAVTASEVKVQKEGEED